MARAKFGYQLVSEDKTQEGIKSAQNGLRGLEESMKATTKVMHLLMGGGAIAGVTMALRKLYQGAKECEAAFLKLHPEMENMAGSAKRFGDAMTSLKAAMGGVIAGGLSPFRAGLTEMVSSLAEAINKTNDLRTALVLLSVAKSPEAMKYLSEINSAQAQIEELRRKRESAIRPMAVDTGSLIGGAWAASGNSASAANPITKLNKATDEWDAKLQESQKKLDKLVADALAALNPQKKKPGSGSGTSISFYDYSMLQNGDIAEIMRNRGPAWLSDFGGRGYGEGYDTSSWPTGRSEMRATGVGDYEVTNKDEWSKFMAPIEAFGEALTSALGPLPSMFSSLSAVLNPIQIIFQSMMEVLTPVMDAVLAPLIGAFSILGKAAGQILAPVITALSPIIDAIGKAFVWLYNNIIVPVGNGVWAMFTNIGNTIKWLVEKIVALGTTIWYIVSFQWAKLGTVDWGSALPERVTAQQGPLTAISTGDLSAAGESYQTSSAGSSASYTQARPITVNVVVNTDVITGENGGFRELAIKMQNEIEAVLALGLA